MADVAESATFVSITTGRPRIEVDREHVPWESLIDTERPEVREAVLKFAEAIEPELLRFIADS